MVEPDAQRRPPGDHDGVAHAVAAVGGWFTYSYNTAQFQQKVAADEREARERADQLRLSRVQTVERFMPYLTRSSEIERQMGILGIEATGDSELAAKIATLLASPGTHGPLAFQGLPPHEPSGRSVTRIIRSPPLNGSCR